MFGFVKWRRIEIRGGRRLKLWAKWQQLMLWQIQTRRRSGAVPTVLAGPMYNVDYYF
jgi:hypothetical protein